MDNKVINPKLIEIIGKEGNHLNWKLIDYNSENKEVLYEEWSEDTLGKMTYDFRNKTDSYIENPNRRIKEEDKIERFV